MAIEKLGRNENRPFHFEILVAGIDFLDLLDKETVLTKIQVKPDRLSGETRRIEDLTKFHKSGTIEVVQIKHTQANDTFGFSDLWTAKLTEAEAKKPSKKEGADIFKYLKSWRNHKKTTNDIVLTVITNRKPTKDFSDFLSDAKKLKINKISWNDFSKKHSSRITSIKTNCSKEPFSDYREVRDFISSLNVKIIPDIEDLLKNITTKLEKFGISDEERVGDFINKITNVFISDDIDVFPPAVEKLINRMKTGLIQDIIIPSNYIERTELENKILAAIELKKKDGGFVLLYAPSGSGKTILLSKLAEKSKDFFPYFCRIRPLEAVKGKVGYSNNERLRSSWFKADIIQRCYEFGLLSVSVSLKDNSDYIDKVFDQALGVLSKKALERKSGKIVIIVDALDQVDTDKHIGASVLDAIPTINYPGLVFLLSTWGEKYLPQSIKDLPQQTKKEVELEMYFSEKEIRNYFDQLGFKITDDQSVILKKKTGGLAISLLYLSKKLKPSSDIDKILQASSEYFAVFDWYKPIWSKLKADEKECLGYLCFHLAKVSRKSLRGLMHKKLSIAEFNNLIDTVHHFLDISGGLIEPYHDSFRRFIITQFKSDAKAYHQKLLDYYSESITLPYAQRYITKHAEIVGISSSSVQGVFKNLSDSGFIDKIIKSNLEDSAKVEIGKSFVEYFFKIKDVPNLIRYAIRISDIYPNVYESDTFEKIRIGSKNLIAEVENELMFPKGDNPWQKKEWLFSRLSAGNVLARKIDKDALNLAHRFIDDGLFRISLDPDLLWGKEEHGRDDFWSHAKTYTSALVNANQYESAVRFYRRITFKKPTSNLIGFLAQKLADIHLENLDLNKNITLKVIAKAPKIERLLTYMLMQRNGVTIPNKKDYLKLLSQQSNEKYLDGNQKLDFAECLFVNSIPNRNDRINRIINRMKILSPYWSHNIYWGDSSKQSRGIVLRFLSLKTITDKTFALKDFYDKSLKESFKRNKSFKPDEYQNQHLIDILSKESELGKNRLLARQKKISWDVFWSCFEENLKIYKEKIDVIVENKDSYRSRDDEKLHAYSQNFSSFVTDNLGVMDLYFPTKTLFILKKIEEILTLDFLTKREGLLEIIIDEISIRDATIQKKIQTYIEKDLELRQEEKLDNMNKTTNLKNLAVLAAGKGFQVIAEHTFNLSLKYSKGLWNKEDPKFSNYLSSLKTQNPKYFKEALGCIEAVSGVIEGEWYWRLNFIGSVAYAYFENALDYHYDFAIKGEVNHDESLQRIISSYTQYYPYKTNHQILPLLKLLDVKNEDSHDRFESMTKSYSKVWNWSLDNKDYKTAENIVLEYIGRINKDIEPAIRLTLLKEIESSLKDRGVLIGIQKQVRSLILELHNDGYAEKPKSSSDFEVKYEGVNIKKVIASAKKGDMKSIFKALEEFNKAKNYFIDRLFAELIPHLSYPNIEEVRSWAKDKGLSIEGGTLFSALIARGASDKNSAFLKKVTSEILTYINNSEKGYETTELIRQFDKSDFPNKKDTIRRILLASIRKLTGNNYYLPQMLTYSSSQIDKYYIELKEYAFPVWREMLKKSMKLSLSK